MKYKAVIFDMDGLLLDTETIAIATFIAACQEYAFDPDLNVFHKCIGVDWETTKEIMSVEYGSSFPLKDVTDLWGKKMDQEMMQKPIPLKVGAFNLLQYLEKEDVKIALVTSTRKEIARKELSNAKIGNFFDFILGGNEVLRGKPNPEIYLTACQKLNEEPINCLALEDSDNGVLAAFHAGITVIQIPDIVQPSAEVKALGHKVMRSLVEVENMLKKSDQAFLK
ncbi:HAD family hydrolase [Chloroflexota bacterium]